MADRRRASSLNARTHAHTHAHTSMHEKGGVKGFVLTWVHSLENFPPHTIVQVRCIRYGLCRTTNQTHTFLGFYGSWLHCRHVAILVRRSCVVYVKPFFFASWTPMPIFSFPFIFSAAQQLVVYSFLSLRNGFSLQASLVANCSLVCLTLELQLSAFFLPLLRRFAMSVSLHEFVAREMRVCSH